MKKILIILFVLFLNKVVLAQLYINGDLTIQEGVVFYSNDTIKLGSNANVSCAGILQSTKDIQTNSSVVQTPGDGFIQSSIPSGIQKTFDIGKEANNQIKIQHTSSGPVDFKIAFRDGLHSNPETKTSALVNKVLTNTWELQPMSIANSVNTVLTWNSANEGIGFNRSNSGVAKWRNGISSVWAFTNGVSTSNTLSGNPTFSQTGNLGNLGTSLYYLGVGDSSSELSIYLNSLTITHGSLTPAFSKYLSSYSNSVPYATSSVNITPTASDPSAQIHIRLNSGSYTSISSGNASSLLNLNVGINTIDIRLTGTDGQTIKTYTITVTRSAAPTISINLTAYLEGLYLGAGEMTASPYNSDNSLSSAVADTIILELHSNSGNFDSVYAWKGAISIYGLANAVFPGAAFGNSYFIVLKHRNSIETWSASAFTMGSTNTYNFSSSASNSYGGNMVNLGSGVFGIYSGDINQDGSIDFLDYPDLDQSSINGDLGYLSSDINGDASVDFLDYPIIDQNSINGIFTLRP